MREALLFCFNLKKSAETHRMFVEAYGDNALSETTCREFHRFNDNNFDLSDKKRKIGSGRLRIVNCRLFWTRTIPNRKKCLQLGVSRAAISMLLHAMGKIQKIGKWVQHER